MAGQAMRSGLFGRALGGGALTAGSFAITQGLRLMSNLVLTRLLFPEAFGLMALVSVVLIGLQMFSDAGVGPAISRSPRGDERDFLDTAWTLNVMRGAGLWLASLALAWPFAHAYAEPQLTRLLPVAGLSLLLAGFTPTRVDTANRHLLLARVTGLDLLAQALGMVATVGLALVFASVWALVAGMVVTALVRLALMWLALPGAPNRLHWDRGAAGELVGFGKWIFLSTACGFLMAQGDKAILGLHLSLSELGLYNIGFFLASFPMMMSIAVVGRIMIPLYRDHPPAALPANAQRIARLRLGLTLAGLGLLAVMALTGQVLVGLLYDPRWAAAGAIVTAVALAQMPMAIGTTYDQAALAAGDGRGYFLTLAARAGLQTAGFALGAASGGIGGALLGQGCGFVLAHGAIIALARRHRVWDPRHDLAMALLALGLGALVWWVRGADLLRQLG